jgi:hypothetical protein
MKIEPAPQRKREEVYRYTVLRSILGLFGSKSTAPGCPFTSHNDLEQRRRYYLHKPKGYPQYNPDWLLG